MHNPLGEYSSDLISYRRGLHNAALNGAYTQKKCLFRLLLRLEDGLHARQRHLSLSGRQLYYVNYMNFMNCTILKRLKKPKQILEQMQPGISCISSSVLVWPGRTPCWRASVSGVRHTSKRARTPAISSRADLAGTEGFRTKYIKIVKILILVNRKLPSL